MRTFAQKPRAAQQNMSAKSTMPGRVRHGQSREVHSILNVQRTVGNQAVQRLLQSKAVELNAGWTGTASPHFGHDFSRISVSPATVGAIQTKLAINMPGDEYEQEADRVAVQVMRMPDPQLQRECSCGGRCPKCQTQQPGREHERLQTKRVQSSNEGEIAAPPIVHEVLRSPGQPLDAETRGYMEPRFGYDFSQVRVHTDAKAAESARAVNAQAYTLAPHIVLDYNRLSPGSESARLLMVHELAHVVQQGGAKSMRGDHGFGSAEHVSRNEIQRQPELLPTSENVWGLRVTRSMCRCRQRVLDGIDWANTAAATYAACDVPANPTSTAVEACFDAAQPGTTVAGSTSSSGTMTLPPPSADPCQRIEDKGTFVHETMHARHTNDIARAQGAAFFQAWKQLAGDPSRLDTLRASFPAQVAAFETQWEDGHDWAQDEVNSYRWERRFLQDALAALNRIC